MELAIIGLGKMGLNMATRLVRGGHRVVGYARTAESVAAAVKNGAEGATSLEDAVGKLKAATRVVWVMVPSGQVTTDTIDKVAGFLKKGDVIIDGGNSNYKETIRHAAMLEARGVDFVDCGTSGGVWGLTEGYSLMVGGKPDLRSACPGQGLGLGARRSAWGRALRQNDPQRDRIRDDAGLRRRVRHLESEK